MWQAEKLETFYKNAHCTKVAMHYNISIFNQVDNENRGRNKKVAWLRKFYLRFEKKLEIEMKKGKLIKVSFMIFKVKYFHVSLHEFLQIFHGSTL